ncbi:1-phosphatidylinositol 4,5-bisphosphate phosphodiesterase epsilon-1 [Pelodiscus sinensis]|uniref:1-phosphatidylinositol 4,5-bisphosphate phosphodiesterase epsilon-1 n=1 Tax=Pelodiscus sinensis TaxID=13735 RepID=UPI003F6CE0BE
MTSEEMAASVLVSLTQGKVIPAQSAGDENSENALDTSVIKRHIASQGKQTMHTFSYLHGLKEEHRQGSLPKIFSLANEEEMTGNRSNENFRDKSTCIPGSVEFLNINCNILKKKRKSSDQHNQLHKSHDSLAEEHTYLETGISTSLETTMFAEIQLKMDGPSVNMKSLRNQSAINKCGTSDADNVAMFHLSYASERNISKALCALPKSFILDDCLQCVNVGNDHTSDSTACTCKLMELTNNCDTKNGQHFCDSCDTLRDKYLCLEREAQKVRVACSGHSFCGSNFTGRMPSKPFLSHFEDCSDNCEEGMEEEFFRNKKERSTLLIRRFCKNDKEVKKSVYTGTRAIVKTLPAGHIGAVAWNYVEHMRNQSDLKHCRIIAEHLTIQALSQELNSDLVKSMWCAILGNQEELARAGLRASNSANSMRRLTCMHSPADYC